MSVFLIAVPRARRLCGRAVALACDGRTMLGPIRILATASARVARAHGNPLCSPALPFGHPPLGRYVVAASLPPGHHRRRAGRYGHLGALVLDPVGGDAAAAGRRVVLHGGPLDPRGRLRPTRGGLRVSNRDMAALLDLLNRVNAAGDPLSSVEIVEAAESSSPAELDRPGGRRVAGEPRRRVEVARRQFLAASAVLLAGIAGGAAGCANNTPSCCGPVGSDWGDGGSAKDAGPLGGGTTGGRDGGTTGGRDGGTTGGHDGGATSRGTGGGGASGGTGGGGASGGDSGGGATTGGTGAGGTDTGGGYTGGTGTGGSDTGGGIDTGGGTDTGGGYTGGDDNGGYTGGGGFG